jgi:hypothetical protein
MKTVEVQSAEEGIRQMLDDGWDVAYISSYLGCRFSDVTECRRQMERQNALTKRISAATAARCPSPEDMESLQVEAREWFSKLYRTKRTGARHVTDDKRESDTESGPKVFHATIDEVAIDVPDDYL